LHGLRATFAAKIKRVTGANDDQVAAALGDRDARKGRALHPSRRAGKQDHLPLRHDAVANENRT
jgi:hypothetical protein